MGGIARLAIQLGHKVTGSDQNCYPPMSEQLEALGIELHQGYDAEQLTPQPDLVIVGNALSRGKPVVEALLESNIPYTSGAQWLGEHILRNKWVLAVAGTHGKTTTASMLTWILEQAGYHPSYLIGGVPANFEYSARLTDSNFFVIEADEYDTAFFDKRSKFVHYHARTLILNNLEFDHADIFPDLAAIENQFHHLVRTVPKSGLVIQADEQPALQRVLERGCWSARTTYGRNSKSDWQYQLLADDGSVAEFYYQQQAVGTLRWEIPGLHNIHNALAATIAARHVGITPELTLAALSQFRNSRRRLELRGEVSGVAVYDDFAHHPTAIRTTIDGLRRRVGEKRIVAVLDIRSNTMKQGVHRAELNDALAQADEKIVHIPEGVAWQGEGLDSDIKVQSSVNAIIEYLAGILKPGDQLLIMSNGGFDNIHARILAKLESM